MILNMTLAFTYLNGETRCEMWSDSKLTAVYEGAHERRFVEAGIQQPRNFDSWFLKTLILDDRICVTISGQGVNGLAEEYANVYRRYSGFDERKRAVLSIDTERCVSHVVFLDDGIEAKEISGSLVRDINTPLSFHGDVEAQQDLISSLKISAIFKKQELEQSLAALTPTGMLDAVQRLETIDLRFDIDRSTGTYGGAFFGAHNEGGKFRYFDSITTSVYVGSDEYDFLTYHKLWLDEAAPIAAYYFDSVGSARIFTPLVKGKVVACDDMSPEEVILRMSDIVKDSKS